MWAAWTLALVGGVTVLGALVLLLNDPCIDADRAVRSATCTNDRLGPVTILALAGTVLAIVGGVVAAILGLRRPGR